MKTYPSIIAIVLTLIQFANTEQIFGQESNLLPVGYQQRVVSGIELGDLVCEDVNGQMVRCSGAIEETILGIVTNVPYITVNKPTSASESKYIFNAQVSTVTNAISRGDHLALTKDGRLEKAQGSSKAYAIAMEDATANGLIPVKVITGSN
jgi:hypothetical protein